MSALVIFKKGYKVVKIFFVLSLFLSSYIISSANQTQVPVKQPVTVQDTKEDSGVVAQTVQTIQGTTQAVLTNVQNTGLNWLHILKRYLATYEPNKPIADVELNGGQKPAARS